jgi:broad specificity phosphatase PhoE
MTEVAEVYLIRHAESEMNTQRQFIGGRSNHTPLTDRGINQARALGQFLKAEGIEPTHVFASPAVRTLQTAQFALREMGIEIEPVIHDDLQELSQGSWEGRDRAATYTFDVLAQIEEQGKDFKAEEGESMNDVARRMHGWIQETLPSAGKEPVRAFVFTHGLAIRCLMSHLYDWTHYETFTIETPNASVTKLIHEEGEWRAEYFAQEVGTNS